MVHAVVGAQFGDEGKGKMVDYFAVAADMVIRYQGGSNAGHTIVNEHGKFGLHLVPSGIFNPKTICVLGTGVVVNPGRLVAEIEELKAAGIAMDGLVISERAHMVLPLHIWQDRYEEHMRSKKVGTTLQGVGPSYQDKAGRFGIQMGELQDVERFRERLQHVYDTKLERMPGLKEFAGTFDEMWTELLAARETLAPHVTDTVPLVREAVESGRNVLLEGQLGIMRDVDWGVYPYVTSSSPSAGGTSAGAGIPPTALTRVTGITKAYTTAVGEGPFPTNLDDEVGEYLCERGQEFGVTTGRLRLCGWLDIPTLRYGAWLNGYTELALMKLDVLSGLSEVKICTAYELNGQKHELPRLTYEMEQAVPVYETLPGWKEDISSCRNFADLPTTAQAFIERVELLSGVSVRYISVGPERHQTIVR